MDPSLMVVHPAMTTSTVQHNLPTGSAESSPRSNHQSDWEDPLPAVPGGKLRLMCSYGGHIIPRPHDKSLCYVGGETRMVVVDRNSSLSDLCNRLSRSIVDGRGFTLKYQLPNEELDSLISVATDEDLENMVEEYDRIMAANSPAKPAGRLRLFLFFAKPETAKTMGVLLDDAKSETWFVDALNGADVLPRGFSDSAAMDDLLSLGSGVTEASIQTAVATVTMPCSDAAEQPKIAPTQQDVHTIQSTMPDAPMIETTTSSFDSSASSPSMAHLPPIRVRLDEGGGGAARLPEGALEEQFLSQLRVTPPLPTAILTPSATAVANTATTTTTTTNMTAATTGGAGEISNGNRVVSDDERSDHGALVVSRKPPLPLPLQTMHQRSGGLIVPVYDAKHGAGGYDLPSPDSVKSDSSIASSTASLSKAAPHQDPSAQLQPPKPSPDPRTEQPPSSAAQNQTTLVQPTQDPNHPYLYPPQKQYDHNQQQYLQASPNMHYIPSHSPIPSYYHPVYTTTQQHHIHPQLDHHQQQYPMYLLPLAQTQPNSAASQPPMQAYPTQGTTPGTNPTGLIQVGPNSAQFHQQYIGYSNAGGGAQPVAPSAANYGHGHEHQQQQYVGYYAGQVGAATTTGAVPVVASQYQSITPAQAAMIAEASMQLPATADMSKKMPRA